MIALLLTPVYVAVNLYLFWRINGWVRAWFPAFRTVRHWAAPVALYTFFALSFLIAFVLKNSPLRRAMKQIGNYWLGVMLYLLLTVALADLGRLVLVQLLHLHMLRSAAVHRAVGCAVAAVLAAVSVLGVVNARIIRVTPYEITVNKQVSGSSTMKVVLLADLHLGYNIGAGQMQRMVEQVNAQDADLVVIAGDIFDNEWAAVQNPDAIAEILRAIRSKYGVYACYGNHDVEEPVLAGFTFGGKQQKASSPEMDAFLAQANIHLLHDSGVQLPNGIYLYGRADKNRPGRGITVRQTPQEITAGLNPAQPVFVIDHEPGELQALADAGVDVDLGGHTHDGQMFPGNLTIRLFWENACGHVQKGAMHSIVTSGVGLFGPNMRVATRAEICPITIHFSAED